MQKYFMNHALKGRPPRKKHNLLKSAIDEAERIARLRGTSISVLQTMARVKIVDGEPVWEFFEDEKKATSQGESVAG